MSEPSSNAIDVLSPVRENMPSPERSQPWPPPPASAHRSRISRSPSSRSIFAEDEMRRIAKLRREVARMQLERGGGPRRRARGSAGWQGTGVKIQLPPTRTP